MPKRPDKIERAYKPERKAFERNNSNSEFYNSWSWRKLRKRFLIKNPLCVHCSASGIDTVATVADHIVPINLGGEKLKENNLQPLCEYHHNKKSGSEASRGMGSNH